MINNNYYMVEIVPKNENYSIRIFFDNNKNLLQYYIDISLRNGLDTDCNIPYYDDLFLDIIITNGEIEIADKNELIDALKNKEISIDDYNLAIKTKDKLLKEIKEKSNKYLTMNIINLLD